MIASILLMSSRSSTKMKASLVITPLQEIPSLNESKRVAERMNRTLLKKACCLCIGSNLPKEFWAEALSTAAYLINRSQLLLSSAKLQKRYGLVNPLIILHFVYLVVLHIIM